MADGKDLNAHDTSFYMAQYIFEVILDKSNQIL